MKKYFITAVCATVFLVFGGCSSGDDIQQTPAEILYITADEVDLPSADFLRFYGETSGIGLPGGQASGVSFQIFREYDGNFDMNLVYPITPSDQLNQMLTDLALESINDFVAANTRGHIHMRPRTFSYNSDILSVVLDLRFYGEASGFTARHIAISYNLYEEKEIRPQDLFVYGVDFRAAFAYSLREETGLNGLEQFTFDDENIYIHMPNRTLTLPLNSLEGIWQSPSPPPQEIRPKMAITFDDGPHYRLTPILLDALAERNIHATFFLLGASAVAHPEIVERMHAEGHQIGNHSYSHSNLTRLNRRQVEEELDVTSGIIYDITGEKPTLLRPPFGALNDMVLDVSREMGMAVALWSVDPQDWRYLDYYATKAHVIDRSVEGSVILLHDIHEISIYAAIYAIDNLMERGYTFVTIDEMYRHSEIDLEAGVIHRGIYRDLTRR
ncbi:MAG: polysaccharide deacetylase family protein [Defluviitaleaceae bacterium]|nr:polysaccharide deacetylase family protein [Defluviitaleaceae bacterium]